jgi:hypothetical protein
MPSAVAFFISNDYRRRLCHCHYRRHRLCRFCCRRCNVPHNPDIRNVTYEPVSPLIHRHRLLCHYRQPFRSNAATAAAVSIICRRHYHYHRHPLCHCRRLCRSMPLPPLPSMSFAAVFSIAAAAITVFATAAPPPTDVHIQSTRSGNGLTI